MVGGKQKSRTAFGVPRSAEPQPDGRARALEQAVAREAAQLGVRAGDGVLAAVSGGADSTALAILLGAGARRLGIRLVLAHVAHRMRPRQDPLDAAHVLRLAVRLGAPFAAALLSHPPAGETEARRLRYEALAGLARENGCAWIALGHTADDQAETVLWNLIRGAGLRGLAGMPGSRPLRGTGLRIVRPLLPLRRDDLRSHLKRFRIPWREDATNRSMRFTRNRIRHTVLPLLERMRPGAGERIARSAREVRSARALLSSLSREALPNPRVPALPLETLRAAPPAVRQTILRRWIQAHGGVASLRHLDALVSLALRGRTGKAVSYPGIGLVRCGMADLTLG